MRSAVRRVPAALIGLAALDTVLRLWLLLNDGPLQWPDSGGYLEAALRMLASGDWLHHTSPDGPTAFRSVGYPAFLAVLHLTTPSLVLVALVQMLLSLVSMVWLYRLGRALGLTQTAAALASWLFLTSHAMLYDLSILTDSLFASLLLVSLCMLLVPLVETGRVGFLRVLAAGVLFAIAFTVRDAPLYLLPVVAAGLLLVARSASSTWRRGATLAIIFALPTLILWQAYLGWNQIRTGQRFVTTVGQSVYLLHPLEIEYRGRPAVRDTRLRLAVDATTSTYTYGHAVAINDHLLKHDQLDGYQRMRLAQAAYWQAWLDAPQAMAGEVLRQLRPKYLAQIVRVGGAFLDYPMIQGGERLDRRALFSADTTAAESILLGLELLSRGISILLAAGCILGIPVLVLLRLCGVDLPVKQPALLFFCWLLYVAMTLMYAAIHLELRYTLPVQAFAILGGWAVAATLWRRWRRKAVPG